MASSKSRDLAPGLYERLITTGLNTELEQLSKHGHLRIAREALDPAEAAGVLAAHVEQLVTRALAGVPERERSTRQAELANRVLSLLASEASTHGAVDDGDAVALPAEQLLALWTDGGTPASNNAPPRPEIPLSASDLLVNARGEPALAHALANEIPSADSIDLLCAFVRWHGLRILEGPLTAHCLAGKPLRVITTVYTGSTERKALDWLVKLGAQVKVSYDTQSTRLHAKAWLFRRETGYSTAYIGSSNLSKSALIDGAEWNVRLSQVGSPDILDKFGATFEGYWLSSDYQSYTAGAEDQVRLDRALQTTRNDDLAAPLAFLEVTAWPHQVEILEKLEAERQRHGRWKNLVVAATGTGKTVIAALDYKRLRDRRTFGPEPRLLFIAHREQILTQALGTYRQVLRNGAFGELYVAGAEPSEWRHVFGSVQSLSTLDLSQRQPDTFDVIVVDEFHHASASTYRRLLGHLRPRLLVGLTATPERTDGEDILHYFDGHIAAEMRLWDALERQLLCPFQYFGVHDNTDISLSRWTRGGYDLGDLDKLYTGNDARVRLVLQQVLDKHRDPARMRALGFCVSIAHAEYMARKFTEAGLLAEAVSSKVPSDVRDMAIAQLSSGALRAVFSVDLFNEGVDIPEVDTLLFLRPTESSLLFLQQLGRGLRRHDSKDCVTVLDFIGQAHQKFRFDLRYRAITGATRTEVQKQIEHGFPFLPAGCAMTLDRVATDIVLTNLKQALPTRRDGLVRELRSLIDSHAFSDAAPTLAAFMTATGLELEDVYKGGSWSDLKRSAGVRVPTAGPQEKALGRAVGRLLYLDDPLRLAAYSAAISIRNSNVAASAHERLLAGLHYGLLDLVRGADTLSQSLELLHEHPALVEELRELLPLLEDRSNRVTVPLDEVMHWPHQVPLSVHARHSADDILTAFGLMEVGKSTFTQKGVFRDEGTNSDIFLITLEKSERDYSPSTLYKDYAISPELFHWESQVSTSQQSTTGQRYIQHRERGGNIFLFVRERRRSDTGSAMPYTFLGPADYVSHRGDRPIAFVWKLRQAMPASLFREARVAAG